MMMTLSPSSTWGVKVGLCLPRRRIATIVARRPTTKPFASISTHFFSMSAALAEYVLMRSIHGNRGTGVPAERAFYTLGQVGSMHFRGGMRSQNNAVANRYYGTPLRFSLLWWRNRIGRSGVRHHLVFAV